MQNKKLLTILVLSIFASAASAGSDKKKESELVQKVKAFFPTGDYRKISGGDDCPTGYIDWREQDMQFGSGAKPLLFHSFGEETQTPPAKDNCSAKTMSKITEKSNNKQQTFKISEKITQQNCGAIKTRVIENHLTGVRHHNKIEVAVSTKDTTRTKDIVCKYERSLP